MIADSCVTIHSKKNFTLSEKRSSVHFTNLQNLEIEQIIVDGCAIMAELRCDYLVNIREIRKSVFVELKGSDVEYALKQLEASYKMLSEDCYSTTLWIVSSGRCPLTSTSVQLAKLKFQRRYGVQLIIRNSPVEHVL